MNKITTKDIFVGGASICAMFFGSGNIVLPLILGQEYGNFWIVPFMGFVLGAVVISILGLIGISLRNGSSNQFFSCMPFSISIALQLLILAIMGPFGITPRCLAVAFGGFKALTNNVPDYLFYAGFSLILLFITYKKDQVMPIISKILSPIKLTMLISVVIICLFFAPEISSEKICAFSTDFCSSFKYGLENGYQTTDLIGAIYFGTILIDYIKRKDGNVTKANLFNFGIKASIVGGLLLGLLYYGFTMLAVTYNPLIQNELPEDILIRIAEICIGTKSSILVGLTIIVSCLTTAVALLSSWNMFITNLINLKFKVSYSTVLVVSVIITFMFSLLGLKKLLDLLGPILYYTYPLIILVTLINLYKDIKEIHNAK